MMKNKLFILGVMCFGSLFDGNCVDSQVKVSFYANELPGLWEAPVKEWSLNGLPVMDGRKLSINARKKIDEKIDAINRNVNNEFSFPLVPARYMRIECASRCSNAATLHLILRALGIFNRRQQPNNIVRISIGKKRCAGGGSWKSAINTLENIYEYDIPKLEIQKGINEITFNLGFDDQIYLWRLIDGSLSATSIRVYGARKEQCYAVEHSKLIEGAEDIELTEFETKAHRNPNTGEYEYEPLVLDSAHALRRLYVNDCIGQLIMPANRVIDLALFRNCRIEDCLNVRARKIVIFEDYINDDDISDRMKYEQIMQGHFFDTQKLTLFSRNDEMKYVWKRGADGQMLAPVLSSYFRSRNFDEPVETENEEITLDSCDFRRRLINDVSGGDIFKNCFPNTNKMTLFQGGFQYVWQKGADGTVSDPVQTRIGY